MNRSYVGHQKGLSDYPLVTRQLDSLNVSRSSSLSDCDNDYLKETTRVAALADDVRREIERRFRRSRTNATYSFPRTTLVKPAPNPPQAPSAHHSRALTAHSLHKLPKTATAKDLIPSMNSSFSRMNDSFQTKSNVSLNASYQRLPTSHSRTTSLTKQIPRNQRQTSTLGSTLTVSKPKHMRLKKTGYVGKKSDSSSAIRSFKGKKLGPTSLDTSLLLKGQSHTKPFISYERMY